MTNPIIPPSVNVSHSIVGCDATTIYITQGRTRFVINDQGGGNVEPHQVIEWVHTLAMSPTAGYQLAMALSSICQDYASRYGPIPLDKDFVAKIINTDGPVQ